MSLDCRYDWHVCCGVKLGETSLSYVFLMNRNLKMQSKRLLAVGSNHSCHSGEGIGNWEDKSAEGRGIPKCFLFCFIKKKKKKKHLSISITVLYKWWDTCQFSMTESTLKLTYFGPSSRIYQTDLHLQTHK